MYKKKGCILSVVIASIILLSTVILFMTKNRCAVADNDRMENVVTEEACLVGDDVGIIIDNATVFESN